MQPMPKKQMTKLKIMAASASASSYVSHTAF
jgi:hypothetical protein